MESFNAEIIMCGFSERGQECQRETDVAICMKYCIKTLLFVSELQIKHIHS